MSGFRFASKSVALERFEDESKKYTANHQKQQPIKYSHEKKKKYVKIFNI